MADRNTPMEAGSENGSAHGTGAGLTEGGALGDQGALDGGRGGSELGAGGAGGSDTSGGRGIADGGDDTGGRSSGAGGAGWEGDPVGGGGRHCFGGQAGPGGPGGSDSVGGFGGGVGQGGRYLVDEGAVDVPARGLGFVEETPRRGMGKVHQTRVRPERSVGRLGRFRAVNEAGDGSIARRAQVGQGGRRRVGASRRARIGWIILGVVVTLVLALGVDALALVLRIERTDMVQTESVGVADPGQTWVIVGSDNRDWVAGDAEVYGDGSTRVGDHADIVIVIHKTATETHTFMVPRDMWVMGFAGEPGRLTMMMARSTNDFVGAMCGSLGIPIDHLLMVRMSTFVNVVDAIGGIEVDFPYDTRDQEAKLSVAAGLNVLDGQGALAYVRSREAEHKINGEWVPVDAVEGANQDRPSSAAEVLSLVMDKVKTVRNPVTWQRLAWAVSGGTVLDNATSLMDLPQLIGDVDGKIDVLPVSENSGKIIALMSGDTRSALAAAGYPAGSCRVTG